MHIPICINTHAHIHTPTHMYTHVHTYMCITLAHHTLTNTVYTCISKLHRHKIDDRHTHTHTCTHAHTHTHMHACTHTHTHTHHTHTPHTHLHPDSQLDNISSMLYDGDGVHMTHPFCTTSSNSSPPVRPHP